MANSERIAELKAALELIERATADEKRELFGSLIDALESRKTRLEGDPNRLDPHSRHASAAMSKLRIFFQRLIGYNVGWVPEFYLEYCSSQGGRPTKYDYDTRDLNCFFITQMVIRGSSESQAMKLLMRLQGDNAMTQGHMRELQDTYRDYKELGRPSTFDKSIEDNAHLLPELLGFDVSNMEGSDRASQNAVAAFRLLFQELVEFMKSSHELVATKDRDYPEIFGPIIYWLGLNYSDPLEYFFGPHRYPEANPFVTQRGFLEYLNMAFFFQEEYGDKSVEKSFFHSRKN